MAGVLFLVEAIFKRLIPVLIPVLIAAAAPAAAADARRGTITAGMLNVRSGPGKNHAPLAVVKKGTPVDVLGLQGEWVRIRFKGKTGWVKNQAAKLLKMNRTTLVEKMKRQKIQKPSPAV